MTEPEDRLAAALLRSLWGDEEPTETDYDTPEEWYQTPTQFARAILAADPTLAADLALAAAVRRLEEQYDEAHLVRGRDGRWWQWDREGLMWVDAGIEWERRTGGPR